MGEGHANEDEDQIEETMKGTKNKSFNHSADKKNNFDDDIVSEIRLDERELAAKGIRQ